MRRDPRGLPIRYACDRCGAESVWVDSHKPTCPTLAPPVSIAAATAAAREANARLCEEIGGEK